MKRTLTVAITGMNARADNPGPGVAVARALKAAADVDVHIIGLGYEALDPGLYLCDEIKGGYLLPYPSLGEEALLARLISIHEREGLDVVIPCLDAELPSFVRLAPALATFGIHSFLPDATQLALRSKERLSEWARVIGLSTPKTQSVFRADVFHDPARYDLHYPLVVKGLFYDAKVVTNADEAVVAFQSLASEWGLPVLAQQWIAGEEVNLAGVGDGNGGLAGAVMMKKRALTDKGKAWAGICIHDDDLLQAAKEMCRVTHWRGAFEMEMLKDEHGQLQLIEINPRFPAWIYFSAGVGCNLPEMLLRLALGEAPQATPSITTGMMFIRYAQEVMVPLAQFESVTMRGHTFTLEQCQ